MLQEMPAGFEAHKLINISLGKIAASRNGRSGASLHKSLLVASVLHKARFVYLEEAHAFPHGVLCSPAMPPPGTPQEEVPEPPRAPTPLPELTVTPLGPDELCDGISDVCRARLESSDACDGGHDEDAAECGRKRRRVCDCETEAAVCSILPKRLKWSDSENGDKCGVSSYSGSDPYVHDRCLAGEQDTSAPHDHDVSNHSNSDGSSSEEEEEEGLCNMEVDHITSLVSIFSFNQQQQQQQQQQQSPHPQQSSDLCSSEVHPHPPEPHGHQPQGPPVLALTA